MGVNDELKWIADKCSFADSNTIGGTFKKIMGEAPGNYRKSH